MKTSNRFGTGKRRIGKYDGYHVIYNRILSDEKLFYFLERNMHNIHSRDVDENKMFDYKDLEYINDISIK